MCVSCWTYDIFAVAGNWNIAKMACSRSIVAYFKTNVQLTRIARRLKSRTETPKMAYSNFRNSLVLSLGGYNESEGNTCRFISNCTIFANEPSRYSSKLCTFVEKQQRWINRSVVTVPLLIENLTVVEHGTWSYFFSWKWTNEVDVHSSNHAYHWWCVGITVRVFGNLNNIQIVYLLKGKIWISPKQYEKMFTWVGQLYF